MPISAKLYASQREKLVALLDETSNCLETLQSRYAHLSLAELTARQADLRAVSKRVFEDIFRIVLVARFQGGKSTSFNALADGAMLSPMGNSALKCSAVPIVAHHTTDPNEIGAYVTLRTDTQLSSLLKEVLEREVRLADPADRQAAIKEHRALIQRWLQNPRIISEDRRDLLFIAGIVLTFYDSRELASLRERMTDDLARTIRMRFEEASSLAQFPRDFLARYHDGDPRRFRPDEVLFPFLDRIACRVRSENLCTIGAAVIDCPGLFANRTDTDIALREIASADAVWFLLDSKQLSVSDAEAVRKCYELCPDRIFFTVNIKDPFIPKPRVIRDVFPTIAAAITHAGVPKTAFELRPYHALLALLSVQGSRLLDNGLDEWSVAQLRALAEDIEIPAASTQEVWTSLAKLGLGRLYAQGLPEFSDLKEPLSAKGIDILRNESGFDEILAAMAQLVIARRGASILLDNGARRVDRILSDDIEQRLRMREDSATADVDRQRGEFDRAKETLDAFETFAEKELSVLEGTSGEFADRSLAEDLYRQAICDRVRDIAASAVDPIREATQLHQVVWDFLRQSWQAIQIELFGGVGVVKSEMMQKCERIIQSEIEKATTHGVAVWHESLRAGRNQTFQVQVVDVATRIRDRIRDKWSVTSSDQGLLTQLPDPTTSVDALVDLSNVRAAPSAAIGQYAGDNAVGGVKRAAGTMISVVIGLVINPLLGIVVGVMTGLFKDEEACRAKLCSDIERELATAFANPDVRENALRKIVESITHYRHAYISAIRAPLARQRAVFDADRAEAERVLTMKQTEREQLAITCRVIRQEHIAPLRTKVREFIESTEQLCGGD